MVLLSDGRKTDFVDRAMLADLPDPQPKAGSKHHKPIHHHQLVCTIEDKLEDRGWEISRSDFAMSEDSMKLFFTMNISPVDQALTKLFPDGALSRMADDGRGFMLGGRAGNDQSMAIRLCSGSDVMVCDNMILSGDDFLIHRKHTTEVRLPELVAAGIDQLPLEMVRGEAGIWAMKDRKLNDDEARLQIYSAFLETSPPVATLKYAREVNDLYFDSTEETAPEVAGNAGTMYGLHNSFTRTFKRMSNTNKFQSTQRLGRFVGLTAETATAV